MIYCCLCAGNYSLKIKYRNGLSTLLLFMKFCVITDGLQLLLDRHCKCIKIKCYVTYIERFCKLLMWFFYNRKFKFALLCWWEKKKKKNLWFTWSKKKPLLQNSCLIRIYSYPLMCSNSMYSKQSNTFSKQAAIYFLGMSQKTTHYI